MNNLGDTKASHVITFLLSFIPLFLLSKYRPKIPWIFVLCVIGIFLGAIFRVVDEDRSWSPSLLADLYPEMEDTPNIFNFDHWSKWSDMP